MQKGGEDAHTASRLLGCFDFWKNLIGPRNELASKKTDLKASALDKYPFV